MIATLINKTKYENVVLSKMGKKGPELKDAKTANAFKISCLTKNREAMCKSVEAGLEEKIKPLRKNE